MTSTLVNDTDIIHTDFAAGDADAAAEVREAAGVEAHGQKMFSVRDLPWMKVGTVINADVNAAEAAKLGGIDFDVELRSINYRSGKTTKTVPNRKAVVRADTDAFFSVVSTGYKVVQYAEAFSFMDAINSKYVAAGAMGGGKQGFMVVQLPGHENLDLTVNGVSDPHDMYVILRTSHDLSKALEVTVMPLRGKCMNQLALPSLTRGAPNRWSIKHVGDPHTKLAQAQSVLTTATKYAEVFQQTVQQLASVTMTTEDFTQVLRRVLPDKPRRDDQIAAITTAYTSSEAVGFTGTGWGAVNAVSEYFQWGRNEGTRTAASQFTSGLSGDARKYINRTTQLLLAR